MVAFNEIPAKKGELAKLLDFANLGVDARESDIRLTCLEARQMGIPVVMVNAVNVPMAVKFCRDSSVKVTAALSYPVGAYPPEVKGLEIEDAVSNGADEICMLMALGVFLDGSYDQIADEMNALVGFANGRTTKYMIESAALKDEQILRICLMALDAGIDFIVTSTDFQPGGYHGATLDQVGNMVECADGEIGIIACGEISTSAQAIAFFEAGANRICTPAARAILGGLK
jgi:deoxyribose-phosphate aldolase